MKRDIAWFQEFLAVYNGSNSYVYTPLHDSVVVELDASLTGLGAIYSRQVYKVALVEVVLPMFMSIVHLEMWNIPVACKVWGAQWHKQRVTIKCDNLAVVIVLNRGGTKDKQYSSNIGKKHLV